MADEVRAFELELKREWLDTVEDISTFVQMIGLQLLSGIVMKTPVDTGRARGNWTLTVGSIDATVKADFDKTGQATITKANSAVQAFPDKFPWPIIYVQNNLPYIGTLENGRIVEINQRTGFPQWFGSVQAPAGMVALTISEVEAQFDGMEI